MMQTGGQDGFTLIEVMIAMAVFTIGILSLNVMQTSAINGNASANRLTIASTWAADRVERIFALDYDDPALTDRTGDGEGEDLDHDGVDDNDNGDNVVDANENFGLHHDTAATADWTDSSPDGLYTIFWNVAVDIPMPATKTIHILVNRNNQGLTKTVTFKYIKSKYM
jgi:type IV pilus modification protein PilV